MIERPGVNIVIDKDPWTFTKVMKRAESLENSPWAECRTANPEDKKVV